MIDTTSHLAAVQALFRRWEHTIEAAAARAPEQIAWLVADYSAEPHVGQDRATFTRIEVAEWMLGQLHACYHPPADRAALTQVEWAQVLTVTSVNLFAQVEGRRIISEPWLGYSPAPIHPH